MSQAGRVLHLYVEVRPAPEDDGNLPGGASQLVLHCPEAPPHSQRSSTPSSSSYSPDLSPTAHLHLEHKPPGQSVSFQLQEPDLSPGRGGRTDDGLGQLLQVLAPGRRSPGPSWSERDPRRGRGLLSPPTGLRGLEGDGGHTSLVTYGYIEKSHVQKMGGHHAPGCRGDPDGRFLPHAQKRLSDPFRYGGPGEPPDPDYPCSDPQHAPPWGWSPATRRRREPAYGSPTLPRGYQPPRCRSWAGSPVLPRSSHTLPSKTPELDGGRPSVNGLPRSPASDRLCAHTQQFPPPGSAPWPGEGASRPQPRDDRPRPPSRFYPPLPAGRPTDIQHQLWVGSPGRGGRVPPSGGGADYSYNACSDSVLDEGHYPPPRCSPSSSRRSPSPAPPHHLAGTRPVSPNLDGTYLHPYATFLGPRPPQPDPRRRAEPAPPQTRPGRISPVPPSKSPPSQSALLDPHRPLHSQRDGRAWGGHTSEAPGSCISKGGSGVGQYGRPIVGGNWGAKGARTSPIGVSGERTELPDHAGGGPSSSQSSSGVTGSMGDSSQPSPETLSQSSQDTSGSGSAVQSDRSPETPPSRSQRIARAKWEFLFGGQREETRCRRDPPFSPSPASPSSACPKATDRRRAPDGAAQRAPHHKVRQIEVELVTSDPCDFAPKTGVIRHTIKYSETDLDAVPLRCYRETDLDEVMRAEAEATEDVSATFENNRSIRGHVSLKPGGACPGPRMDGGKGGRGEEEEEGEEEGGGGGTAGWASLKLLGHRGADAEDEVFRASEASSNAQGGLKSPISIGSPRRPSENNLDSFSRHFESIMESHRAKGTSYSSLDSVDLLTSGSTSVFTFDLPTLTPEIQSQICESAKQIIELSFAPLTHPDPSALPETSRSEISLSASGAGLQSGSRDDSGHPVRSLSEKASWQRSILKDGFRKANSTPSLHGSPRERRPPELLCHQAERPDLDGSDDGLANGTKADLQAAKRLAKRLYNLEGFRKSDVARHLSKNNEFSQMVVEEYLSNFDFAGMTIDQALRAFLKKFALIGETQERERVLAHFSKRYREGNRHNETTDDSVHTLTCAVMLLNTDLHGNNVGKRMSCNQFISNLEGLNDGHDFPKDLLKTLYNSIKNEKLQWTIDEEELKSAPELSDAARTDSASHTMRRLGSGGNPLVGVAQQADGELYKSGFLVRKVHADPDGKRTPRGKRGWKSFCVLLKGLVLYLQKDEYRAERELTEEDVKNAVSVHHSLAMRAADYSKRPNVFYLRTADWRVFLFQAPNAEEMQSWITRINLVAAMFSAPPFPAAIGSQKRFSRPLLPGSNTKLTQEEQAKSHENRFRSVCSELVDLTASTPERKVKGRELEEQKARQEYLEFEKTRYGTYAMLLRAKLLSGDEDLPAFEARLFSDGGLQRAHSSPTLPQDSSASKEKPSKKSKSMKAASSAPKDGGRDGGGGGGEPWPEPQHQRQSGKQEEA